MIPSLKGFTIPLSLFLLYLLLLSLRTRAAPTFLDYDCPNGTTYAPNSTYQDNLDLLFAVLSSNSTVVNGFYNFTAGRSPPDVAYGLFLCRGDVSPAVCQDCVTTATKDVPRTCPQLKVVTLWYDQCMLRFSNQSIFSKADQESPLILYNVNNVSDPRGFSQVLQKVMDDLVTRAPSESGKKFATGQGNLSSGAASTLYGLAQCTPDLTQLDCTQCLQSGQQNLIQGKQGGRVLFPSCNVRYEVYQFYNITAGGAAPPPPPPVLPPPPPGSSSGKTHNEIGNLQLLHSLFGLSDFKEKSKQWNTFFEG